MHHNKYPSLAPPSTHSHPQNPSHYHHQHPHHINGEPVLVGVPVQFPNPNNMVHGAIPFPQGPYGPQMTHQHIQPIQPQHAHHHHQGFSLQSQPQSRPLNFTNQNKGYVELTETHHMSDLYPESHVNQPQEPQQDTQTNPTPLYPQLGNPMVNPMMTPDPQFRPIGAEMLTTPVVYNPALLYAIGSREPQIAVCKKCNKYVQTIVRYEVGTGTVISSLCLAFLGAVPCFWVPCCIKDLKDAVHYCPVCGDELGKKKFIVN